MEQNHNWYATIQSRILCATDISANQKLLIALIANLSNAKGYCFASNEYLGKRLNIKKDSVRKLLTDLEDKNYIGRVIKLRADYSVELRVLTVVERHDNPTTFDVEDEVYTPKDESMVPPGQISPTPQINILDPQDKSAYIITKNNNKVNNKVNTVPKEEISELPSLDTVEQLVLWCIESNREFNNCTPNGILYDPSYHKMNFNEKELYLMQLTKQLQTN
jgi:DNA-binding MarR family transcriptional regulator